MVISKNSTIFACDFETTVYEYQTHTEVWSAAYAQLFCDNVKIFHSLDEFIEDLIKYRKNIICYFHNLRFDGTFIVNWLLEHGWEFTTNRVPHNKQFKTLISKQNRWYTVTLGTTNGIIEIRDSVKLMPLSLKQVGEAFQTEHRKGEMEYKGYRYAGCKISNEEMKYIINDVLVLKEALEYMLNSGNKQLTIGSCAMKRFKDGYTRDEYKTLFPDLLSITVPESFNVSNVYEFIRKSYRGGWCYLKNNESTKAYDGITIDVNSLYPSVMHSISGNSYPVGKSFLFEGDIPERCKKPHIVYYVMIKCRFSLKENMLPTIQIKDSPLYQPTEWLMTSDIYKRGRYHETYIDENGKEVVARPTLYLSKIDYELFCKHYNVYDYEIVGGVWFYTRKGLFDNYINEWMTTKQSASNKAERTEAKLFLNNLYGKFATSTDSSYQTPILLEDGSIGFELCTENAKVPGYIAVGALVTSYARHFTITAAQKNYSDFIYADTDSLHMEKGDMNGVELHESNMCCWKLESEWSTGIFIRQKTYAEFVRRENGKKVNPHWEIKCAGMPERSKKIFLATHPITDFAPGLSVGGKLVPKRIRGGIVLEEKKYTLREKKY